ncbi:MAG: hypothetical protein EBU01_02240, partial [Crocinitomicaceae bacterium]|nr:hypothetical protein [Crocinitomicaceae bacterium]
MFRKCFYFLLLLILIPLQSWSQLSSSRELKIAGNSKQIKLDSLSIYPNSFIALKGKDTLKPKDYQLDYCTG